MKLITNSLAQTFDKAYPLMVPFIDSIETFTPSKIISATATIGVSGRKEGRFIKGRFSTYPWSESDCRDLTFYF